MSDRLPGDRFQFTDERSGELHRECSKLMQELREKYGEETAGPVVSALYHARLRLRMRDVRLGHYRKPRSKS